MPRQRSNTTGTNTMGPVQRLLLAFAGSATLLLAGTYHSAAFAQVSQVEPYWAYVTEGDSLLRSGFRDAVEYYPVAKLSAGTLVRVDAQGGDWMQVTYPPGTPAFVPFDSASVDLTSKSVTLTKQSRLSAANMNDGLKGSWRPLLAMPLEPGTKLTLVDTTPVESNRGKAWKVAAPSEARGYLPTKSIRKASESEISSYLKANPVLATPAKVEPATPPQPAKPDTTPTVEAAPTQPQPMDLRDPSVGTPAPERKVEATTTPSSTLTTPTNTTPTGTTPDTNATSASQTKPAEPKLAENKPESRPVAKTPTPTQPVIQPPRPMEKYAGLESAFRAVQAQPVMEGEYSELIAEYQKAIDEAPAEQTRLKTALGQRLELLKIRADLQAQKRQMQADHQSVQTDKAIVEQKIADFDRARQYVVVGRLSASTIYDGVRLPLMYRVQTVGGASSGRTLGYVKPQDGVNPERFIGAIVGIVGQSQIDPSLKLNIVSPTRIDSLESLPGASADLLTPGVPTVSTNPSPINPPAEQPKQAEAPTDWVSPSDPR